MFNHMMLAYYQPQVVILTVKKIGFGTPLHTGKIETTSVSNSCGRFQNNHLDIRILYFQNIQN